MARTKQTVRPSVKPRLPSLTSQRIARKSAPVTTGVKRFYNTKSMFPIPDKIVTPYPSNQPAPETYLEWSSCVKGVKLYRQQAILVQIPTEDLIITLQPSPKRKLSLFANPFLIRYPQPGRQRFPNSFTEERRQNIAPHLHQPIEVKILHSQELGLRFLAFPDWEDTFDISYEPNQVEKTTFVRLRNSIAYRFSKILRQPASDPLFTNQYDSPPQSHESSESSERSHSEDSEEPEEPEVKESAPDAPAPDAQAQNEVEEVPPPVPESKELFVFL